MKENPKFKGIELDNNNQPIEGTEFIGWHSRSLAVVVVITDPAHQHFLVEKRGVGCPDNVGKLCLPCGYLNWDETLKDAAIREVYEETGLFIKQDQLQMLQINDNVDNNRQNVSVYFIAEIDSDEILDKMNSDGINTNTEQRGGEGNECEKIMWVTRNYVNLNKTEFCFKHEDVIEKVYNGSLKAK